MGNSAAPIPGIPGGAVSHRHTPTSPCPKSGHRTPGTLIRLSSGEFDSTTDHRKQLAWNYPSQPAYGFLCPRLPELPSPLASQVWLLNTSSNSLHLLYPKDTGYFLSPHLNLPKSASRTCHQSGCVSQTLVLALLSRPLLTLWFHLETHLHFPHPEKLYAPNPLCPIQVYS